MEQLLTMKLKDLLIQTMALFIGLMICCSANGQDWNEFRGLNGSGRSDFKNIPTEWSDDSASIVWKTLLPGLGWSSPVISKNEIWLTPPTRVRANCRFCELNCLLANCSTPFWFSKRSLEISTKRIRTPLHPRSSMATLCLSTLMGSRLWNIWSRLCL